MKVSFKSINNIKLTVNKVYAKNRELIEKLVADKPKKELFEIENELNQHIWDTEKLGEFISDEIGTTLLFYLEKILGRYEILKYWHLEVNKNNPSFCKTEEEFKEWILSRVFNELNPSILE